MIIEIKDRNDKEIATCEVFRDDEYDMLRRGNSHNCLTINFDQRGYDDDSDEVIIIKINQVVE